MFKPLRFTECDVTELALSVVDVPYAVVVPYSTWLSEPSSVVQLTVALAEAMLEDDTAEMTGGVVSVAAGLTVEDVV